MFCKHGDDLCDVCLDILADGEKQGREAERAEILEFLQDHDSGYLFHSECALCDAIKILKDEPELHTFLNVPGAWPTPSTQVGS